MRGLALVASLWWASGCAVSESTVSEPVAAGSAAELVGTSRPAVPRRPVLATSTPPVWRSQLDFASAPPGAATGTVTLRWLLAPGAPVAELVVSPGIAGVSAGPLRDEGWRRLDVDAPTVILTPGGSPVEVASGTVASGRYDRVFASADYAVANRSRTGPIARTMLRVIGLGGLHTRQSMPVTQHVEPVARGFTLPPGGRMVIEIELVVLPRPRPPDEGRLQVFVKDARIVGAP